MATTHTLAKPGSYLDLLLQQQLHMVSNDVVINNASADLTDTIVLSPNAWYTFDILALLTGDIAKIITDNIGLDLAIADISDGWAISRGWGWSNDTFDSTFGGQEIGWNRFSFDDTVPLWPLPELQSSADARYFFNWRGKFKTGAAPTLKWSYQSHTVDVDNMNVEMFTVDLRRATHVKSMTVV